MQVIDLVSEHVQKWARIPFAWGTADCCIVLADYVRDVTGIDGAAPLRGAYADRAGWRALGDDLSAIVGQCAARVPLDPTSSPQRGDIGVIQVVSRAGIVTIGGICLKPGQWAAKEIRGVTIASEPEVVSAWSVPFGSR